MSMFNLGGPGWFNDVFEVELETDGTRTTTCHSLLFQETCPLVTTSETLTGHVVIRPPPNRTVWQGGVKLLLESTLSFFESLSSTDKELVELKLQDAGPIDKELTLNFEFDLSKLPPNFVESYDGEMFSVRHSLVLTIERPWYTFDVMRSMTIAIHSINTAPGATAHKTDDDLALPLSPRSPPQGQQESVSPGAAVAPAAVSPISDATVNRIRVVDVYQGLSMVYESAVLNLGDTFRGEITFGGGNPASFLPSLPARKVSKIEHLQVVIYKIESGEGDSNEVIVLVHEVELPGKKAPASESSDGQQEQQQQGEGQTSGVIDPKDYVPPEPVQIPVEIPIAKAANSGEFGPTMIKPARGQNEDDPDISVRYFVRLVAISAESNNFWNTHELVLYRSAAENETA